jgi:uncharacterized protein (TIGR00255 family)
MAIKSMTGFARRDGSDEPYVWHWEIRTLNARGLDIRLRLPSGFEAIEARVREMCKKQLARGNCTLNLTVKRTQDAGQLRLNEQALREASAIVERAQELTGADKPALDALLGIKGVIEFADAETAEDNQGRHDAVLADLGLALADLETSRTGEGAHLQGVLADHFEEIDALVKEIDAAPAYKPEAILERLTAQILRLMQTNQEFDEQRLHQEAALLATKADIAEELDRLRAHIASARELLDQDDPVGRRFEFLAQEFNREANTICSKSNDGAVTKLGLALKAVIDRVREQVQNVE